MSLLINKQKLSYQIRTYACDSKDRLKISTLFNFFQSAAEANIESADIGYKYLNEHHIGWIAVDYKVKFLNFPKWGDEITIETWPSSGTSLYGIRDFRVTREDGQEMILATSRWVLIDLISKKPLSYKKIFPNFNTIDDHALDSTFSKIEIPLQTDFTKELPIRHDDIDSNHHVNNSVYPAFILEGLPDNFIEDKIPSFLSISFKNEAKYGETLIISSNISHTETFHQLTIKETNKIAALMHLSWQ